MDDLLDDDDLDFDSLDESDLSFKRKRPTEASWDSDDELLQEDHIPVKKTKTTLSDDELDEDALLGDSDNEDFSTYDGTAEGKGPGEQTEDSAPVEAANVETNDESYEYGVDDQTNEQTEFVGGDAGGYDEQLVDEIDEYQGAEDHTGEQTGVGTSEISAVLDNTESEEWGGEDGEAAVGGDYEEEEGEEQYQEEGGDNFEEEGRDNFEEEGGDNFDEGYNEDVAAEDEEEIAVEDEDAALLEDAIELEPGMDDILDIEDFDDSLIDEVPEDNTMSGRTAKLASSTPNVPVREKPASVVEVSKPKEQVSSQPIHSEEKEDEEGSDTKEDIPSSDSDEDEDDDNTRARFKSERRPVAVKVGGASKRKDIPETLEITAGVQQTLDDYARQKEEQQWGKRNRGRGGRGFRGNRGNHGNRHQGPPPMMGMHQGNMGPRFPGHMGPADMPPRPAFQNQEVVRGPPAGHLRGGRFDFEPYQPGKGSPHQGAQGSGQEPFGSNQGGQRSSSPHTQAPPAQQPSQPGAAPTSQPQTSVSKKIHINPHFKGQVQVPSQQVAPQAAHPPAVHSSAPTHSQYQPPSTVSTHYQQPSNPYPNQYSTQPYSQHGAVQGQPPQPMQTQPTSHSQGPRPLMEQQHPASYRDPNHHHGDQQSGQWMPPSSQHPTSASWTQPGRRSPVSVTWSHQQGPPRREFDGHQPHQHSQQFNRAQTPQERIPPHQQFQAPRGMQPNQMRPHSEPQHQGGPGPHQQGQPYHGQGPQSARQGSDQRYPTPSNQQPGQFTSQQHRPQGSSVQPSPTPNQANKGNILPSPKRLIEEASKKAPNTKQVKGEIDEDAETRKLRIQLEEQKKLREMILKRKEARRQQLAASKQAELKKRLSTKRGKSSSESSDTKKTNREQKSTPQKQQQRPNSSQCAAGTPGPRQPTTTQQPPNQAGNRATSSASNRNNSAQSQQWAGGPEQPRPMTQPIRHDASPLLKQEPPTQLFQQQTWQQQQNVKVLVDMDPQPIPTVGAGGRVQPQQSIGVVGLANRAPTGQVRSQHPGQVRGQQPGQIRGQHPGQIRGQQPGQIRGQQPGQIRGQQPGQIRGRHPGQIRGQHPGQIRGQQPGQVRGQQPSQVRGQHPGQIRGQHPGQIRGQQPGQIRGQQPGQIRNQHPGQIRGQHPGQIRGQHPGQIRSQHPGQIRGHQPGQIGGQNPSQARGQRPQGPPNNMGRGRGRGQPRQRFPGPRMGQPQGNGPRPQGPRPLGQGGLQFRGPTPQGMAPRPQGPGTPQGGPMPQKRSVKDRIGLPQKGPAPTQQAAPQQAQRRVVQQQSPQQAQKTTTFQGAGSNQPGQPGNKRTVVQNLIPQQRLLQQKQQQRLAQRPQGGAKQQVRVLPPQPQRVVKQMSAESPQVVRGPLGILIDGLSASTNKKNLMKMMQSCGPVKTMEIVASERRAYAKFCRPEDAMTFQTKFHRHMIDLATISVSLIPD
ncbi:chromatin modification-related protein eaf-1-like [Asterias rubens]|uniref:chromatin modification-related protein eaf-1-like n=1 Tax=Asterias rubens TaxID=7604 RepID=UPI001455533F|nr:chromatin modification-related protein eaf-1-like [Asterias rubens]